MTLELNNYGDVARAFSETSHVPVALVESIMEWYRAYEEYRNTGKKALIQTILMRRERCLRHIKQYNPEIDVSGALKARLEDDFPDI